VYTFVSSKGNFLGEDKMDSPENRTRSSFLVAKMAQT